MAQRPIPRPTSRELFSWATNITAWLSELDTSLRNPAPKLVQLLHKKDIPGKTLSAAISGILMYDPMLKGILYTDGQNFRSVVGAGQDILNGNVDFSTSPDTTHEVVDIPFSNLFLVGRLLTLSGSGIRGLRFSTDNGSSFFSGASDYVTVDGAGVETTSSYAPLHVTGSASARSFAAYVNNLKAAPVTVQSRDLLSLFVGSTDPVNAVQLMTDTGVTINGGTLGVFTQ